MTVSTNAAGSNSLSPQGGLKGTRTPPQIRVLTLNNGENLETTLYRLQKGWKLQFRLGPTMFGRRVNLYTNHPTVGADGKAQDFYRSQYRQLTWLHESRNRDDDTASFANLLLVSAGSFHYYFIDADSEDPTPCGSGYFLVDPVLTYGFDDEVLPLDCIQCQTVLSKCLGSFTGWEDRLRVAAQSGYNMIHFTPVQELGGSLSGYSLKNQLLLNPMFNTTEKTFDMDDLKVLVQKMRNEWKVLSICDIVLNHTANESPWLKDHPEAAYNLVNSPHMRPAFLLDRLLWYCALDIGAGKHVDRGIPIEVTSEDHLAAIGRLLRDDLIPALNLHDFYLCHADNLVAEFRNQMEVRLPPYSTDDSCKELKLIQDPQYRRLKATVDWENALRLFNVPREGCWDEESRRNACAAEFRRALEHLNGVKYNEICSHLSAAVTNVLSAMRYERVQWDGPRIKEVSARHPLVPQYFYRPGRYTLAEEEAAMYNEEAAHIMAHNGWVMNDDPLRNFAEAGSNIYIRRELIAWGDSVKLRYGEKPEDCPYLWEHMKEYTEQTARIFHGIRLDNCHSTPIHVAEYLIDAARRIRPDLYVIAELFTNSDVTDNVFVNKLGISSLIREALSAGDSHEEGRLVYRYGGDPVGAFIQPIARPLQPCIAHAIFLDQTHDNPSPAEKRSIYDLLPSTALVSMASCATGSNRGYDELVPHHIHVVNENRHYTSWSETASSKSPSEVNFSSGIIKAKKALNKLHFELGAAGFSQVFVDQMTADVVAVTRHSPITHESVVLIAHTAFQKPHENADQGFIRPLVLQGSIEEVVLEAELYHSNNGRGGTRFSQPTRFVPSGTHINGSDEYVCEVREHIPLEDSRFLQKKFASNSEIHLDFKNFVPGCVVAVRVSLNSSAQAAVVRMRNLITGLALPLPPPAACLPSTTPVPTWEGLQQALSSMTLADLNIALYRCQSEEVEDGRPGAFVIPNFGPLIYCGLQGIMTLLSEIRPKNDLGHPLCGNLREGDWLAGYITGRLQLTEGTALLGKWLELALSSLADLPRYLVPCYFDAVITGTYFALLGKAWSLMSKFVGESSTFVKALSLGSVQCGGVMHNALLPHLSPSLAPPLPPVRTNKDGTIEQACVTLSAGLPHFSVGYMRNWGRDTFISLRGLFLLTGRYQEARYMILAYGGCLRHGLIPNLLDGGKNARFNCRDAVWWWLRCIQDYVNLVPRGHTILDDSVARLFPEDDSPPQPPGTKDQPLFEVIQEALERHFQGLSFRERNAGFQIDREMSDEGFNNLIGVDKETGFVYGGNVHNCGTWMDKMGSSEKAGNKGKPATPRDGSAVEIVGLCRSAVAFLWKLYTEGKYSYPGVQRTNEDGTVTRWTFEEWARKIDTNFERCFWIGLNAEEQAEVRADLVNQREIYKDSYRATQFWADYQLRPNFVVAMVVAPEMFTPANAWQALQTVRRRLLGPLGLKTLDPSDWAYRGSYYNSDQGCDPSTAHGFNYHQGPEWLWPIGYYLRALVQFAPLVGGTAELRRTVRQVKSVLSRHFVEVQQSPWRSLPELTNENGAFCPDSSPAQAWSMATVLEVLYELDSIEQKETLAA